jgi:hypothetical protein
MTYIAAKIVKPINIKNKNQSNISHFNHLGITDTPDLLPFRTIMRIPDYQHKVAQVTNQEIGHYITDYSKITYEKFNT